MQSEIKLKASELYLLSLISGLAPMVGIEPSYKGVTSEELDELIDADFEEIKNNHTSEDQLSDEVVAMLRIIQDAYKVIEIDGIKRRAVYYLCRTEERHFGLRLIVDGDENCRMFIVDYDAVFNEVVSILKTGIFRFRIYCTASKSFCEYAVRSYGGTLMFSLGGAGGTVLGRQGIKLLVEQMNGEEEKNEGKHLH